MSHSISTTVPLYTARVSTFSLCQSHEQWQSGLVKVLWRQAGVTLPMSKTGMLEPLSVYLQREKDIMVKRELAWLCIHTWILEELLSSIHSEIAIWKDMLHVSFSLALWKIYLPEKNIIFRWIRVKYCIPGSIGVGDVCLCSPWIAVRQAHQWHMKSALHKIEGGSTEQWEPIHTQW